MTFFRNKSKAAWLDVFIKYFVYSYFKSANARLASKWLLGASMAGSKLINQFFTFRLVREHQTFYNIFLPSCIDIIGQLNYFTNVNIVQLTLTLNEIDLSKL